MKIEVKRIGAVIVGDQLLEFKGGVEVDGQASIQDAEGNEVGGYEGGIIAGRDKDDKEWFVSLHDVRAIRMR